MKASRDELLKTLNRAALVFRGMSTDRLLPPTTRAACERLAGDIDAVTQREEDEE